MNYTIRPGDTLWSIAARYGVTVQAIMQANGITNPSAIYVGQTIRIPIGGGLPFPPFPSPGPEPTPGAGINQRIERLERQQNQLERRIDRLDQRVDRLEARVRRLES